MAELKSCPFCGEIPYIERKLLWKEYGGSTEECIKWCDEHN